MSLSGEVIKKSKMMITVKVRMKGTIKGRNWVCFFNR